MSDNRTDLPSPNSNNFSQRVRETLMTYLGRQGNPLDRGLTLRDLISAGLLKLRDGVTLRPGVQPPIEPGPAIDETVDLTPPPQPTGFIATAGITNIIVEHDPPVFPMGGGYLRTRLYGATRQPGDPLPTFDDAVEIAQFTGQVYAHSTNPSTTWHLWIKWETKAEVLSPTPAGGTNGVEVRTGEDVALLLEALQGQITESQLYQDLGARIDLIDGPASLPGSVAQRIATEAATRASETGDLFAKYTVKIDTNGYVSGFGLASTANNATPFSEFIVRADSFAIASPSGPGIAPAEPFFVRTTPTTINGVSVPAGVYIQDGFIQNGTITNAKIANATIDDAKIGNVSASKLTAGSIAVGAHIQSSNYVAGSQGWIINGNGSAEFSNATVRGTVFANNGQFLGTLLGGSATTYANGLGFYSGWSGASTDANYRWRVGSPTGARIQWTGSAVEVYNDSNQLTLSSGGVDWAAVANKPAFGIFATAAQLTSSNIGTYIAKAAIGTAQIADASITSAKIASIALVGTSNFSVKTAATGARMEMDSRAIKVFDASGVLRVQLGDLTV